METLMPILLVVAIAVVAVLILLGILLRLSLIHI